MNFWFDESGNLGGFLPSRECPACAKMRLKVRGGTKAIPAYYLRCWSCKTRQYITEEVYQRLPQQVHVPTGYHCPDCRQELTAFGQRKGFCSDCGKEQAFSKSLKATGTM